MNQQHKEILKNDFKEVLGFKKVFITLKLFYYFLERPVADFFLRKYLNKRKLNSDFTFNKIDRFLLNEGGMFKNYAYKICDKFYSLRNSTILVPGVGYGHNLFQLASFHPRRIVGFDLYEYPEEWAYIRNEVKEKFGVELIFLKGDFPDLPDEYRDSFDFIISDAVLEHVRNMKIFMESSRVFLKKNGIFYASFGPLWYGPGGDHIDWGKNRIFNHLVDSEKEYCVKVMVEKNTRVLGDSCEGVFMYEKKLFSYLKAKEYFETFSENGFKVLKVYAKISSNALSLLSRNKTFSDELDARQHPLFDRYCLGFYAWMKNT